MNNLQTSGREREGGGVSPWLLIGRRWRNSELLAVVDGNDQEHFDGGRLAVLHRGAEVPLLE